MNFLTRDVILTFDPRGTGSVVLSGFFNAARLSAAAAGTPLTEQRILFFGAGSAGIGVAKQLLSFFTLQGLSVEEARDRIWVSSLCFIKIPVAHVSLKDRRLQGPYYC